MSELRRPRCIENVSDFALSQPRRLLFTTELNIAEIRFGRDLLRDVPRQQELDKWLDTTIRPWFSGRILPLTENALVIWRHLVESGRNRGYTFPEPDALIAALAIEHELVVVTRDTQPFLEAKVDVLDPWTCVFVKTGGASQNLATLNNPALLQSLATT